VLSSSFIGYGNLGVPFATAVTIDDQIRSKRQSQLAKNSLRDCISYADFDSRPFRVDSCHSRLLASLTILLRIAQEVY